MQIAKDFCELVGHTPILELCHIEAEEGLSARLFAKLEGMNPGGSSKDRVACSMLEEAKKSGMLKPNSLIIEPTSGNTGIGLAAVAAAKGYRCVIVMPDSMSIERRKVLKALGAELILTPGAEVLSAFIHKAAELLGETPGSFMPSQFDHPANPVAHEKTTAPELWEQMDGNIDLFVAGIGTGGTVTGTGRWLKRKNPAIKVVGYEPKSSPLLTENRTGSHKIQGIGPNVLPKNVDLTVMDEVLAITDEDAYRYGRLLAAKEGILCGISSGGALAAAVELAKRPENAGKNIVVLFPDTGNRYLSGDYFE